MMNDELKSMLEMGARLARGTGATEDDVAAVVLSEDYLMDLRRQVAELHADVAELWVHLRKMKDGAKDGHV